MTPAARFRSGRGGASRVLEFIVLLCIVILPLVFFIQKFAQDRGKKPIPPEWSDGKSHANGLQGDAFGGGGN